MNEEVLIPKMKRVDKKQHYRIKIPLINLVFIFSAILLIICSTFVNINISYYFLPTKLFSSHAKLSQIDFIFYMSIIPQIPAIMFLTSALGKRVTLVSVLFYLIIGLCGVPVFALGGGVKYIAQFGFGYLLAYLPAVVIAGDFLKEKHSFANMIKASILGVLTIHIFGILYMVIIALFRHAGITFMNGWIISQSGIKIIYDIIFSFILILIGKYINEGLKYISR